MSGQFTCAPLSGLGRSSVATQEPSIVDKGPEVPKKIEVPKTPSDRTHAHTHSLAQI